MKSKKQICCLVVVGTLMLITGVASAKDITAVENDPNWAFCPGFWNGNMIADLRCDGAYCAELSSDCKYIPNIDGTVVENPLDYISDEAGRTTGICPEGNAIVAYRTEGDETDATADNVYLGCLEMQYNDGVNPVTSVHHANCTWTKWISEETYHESGDVPTSGANWWDWAWWNDSGNFDWSANEVSCAANQAVAGMQCSNGWCDNMRLYCCELAPDTTPPSTGCTCPSGCGTATTVNANFSIDGPYNACYFVPGSSAGNHMNNWENNQVNINGVDLTNPSGWVFSSDYPAQVDGGYWVYINGSYAWSHFEMLW